MTTQTSTNTISILGCGWLGLPLAAHLVREGYAVKGSVTQTERFEELTQKEITPYQVEITDTSIISNDLTGFLESEILIINIPPSRREDVLFYHQAQMKLLLDQVLKSPAKHVIFISSTSVYPDLNQEVTELETAPPSKDSGKVLLAVEKLFRTNPHLITTIVRFAGLIGYDRLPGRFLAGKKNVENGDAPINVIHQDDCIALITGIIEKQAWGEIFNACADMHPTRREFYTKAAAKAGLELPTFAATTDPHFKIINSDKIKQRLNYSFRYPDPLGLL
ncbi:SDR family oxidoreductase [Chitinophaga ginsengisoli]|uniref:Nucleoside-diphosphate-sugar epimerase n=1 Tax=Chitinophaga ginsengisoli TaxID=363837 RepID=A0A2P8FXE2_9BACT|nr:SDR family oxidoreductase [Chitinophaga ginsengisoli]PSL26379.1 nucleoside-diphosphate-sugar epimerase [Chitinophaga ginsengisoli]